MRKIISNLDNWPTTKAGDPIFTCTEEAYFYANLIFNDEKRIKRLRKAMESTRQIVNELRKTPNQTFNKIFPLACKAQFYRECLEECDRIHNDKFFA